MALDVSFHDDEFPPALALEGSGQESGLIWVPASMLLSGDSRQRVPLFFDIDPGDVRQGAIGDCWLIAAMSCLANFPEEVEGLFTHQGPAASADGKYTLRLFDHRSASFVQIVVDERVPVKKPAPGTYYPGWEHLLAGLPIFAKPSNVEFWPLLVEKAMAKLFGGFAGLQGGHECAAFRAFTGCMRQESWRRLDNGRWRRGVLRDDELSTFVIHSHGEHNDPGKMWDLLEDWTAQNFLLAASIAADGDAERRRPDGLVEQHAYSVLTSIQVGGIKMIKLRNPWGSDAEWTGDWSDDSELWGRHANIAELLDFKKAPDGIFWMDWRDFSSIFNSLDVSHKSMRTGPGVTRSAAWQSRARNRDSAPAASSNSASASPHTIAPAPPRAHGVLSLERMDTDEQIEAAIALSLQDLDATSPSPFAPPPPPSSEPVRSAAAAASTKGPTSPPKDGNLKRNDSSQRTVCRFFKVSFLACH